VAMTTEHGALHQVAAGLALVAREMAQERAVLQRRLVALSWRGLAAEAVRGMLTQRMCALADARERHLDAAEAVLDHARLVERRRLFS